MKLVVLLTCTLAGAISYGQTPGYSFADTASIYKGFGRGGSTANLRHFSKVVDTVKSARKIRLDQSALDTLNFLIGKVQPSRHFQQKVGRSYYASIIKSNKERRIAIVPDWAIIDLKNKKQYVFRGTAYEKIYNRFVTGHFN